MCVCVCLQVIRKGEVSCCWTCTPCKENEFVFDEYTCRACVLGSWPTDDLTGKHTLFMCLLLTNPRFPNRPEEPWIWVTHSWRTQNPLTSYVPHTTNWQTLWPKTHSLLHRNQHKHSCTVHTPRYFRPLPEDRIWLMSDFLTAKSVRTIWNPFCALLLTLCLPQYFCSSVVKTYKANFYVYLP